MQVNRAARDEAELQSLVEKEAMGCRVCACENTTVDSRGGVAMALSDGTPINFPVCEDHFEAIFTVVGEQRVRAEVDHIVEEEDEWEIQLTEDEAEELLNALTRMEIEGEEGAGGGP
jgi:hypothetical protein